MGQGPSPWRRWSGPAALQHGVVVGRGFEAPAPEDPALQQPFEAEGADPFVKGRALSASSRAAAETFQPVWSSA